MPSPLPPLNGLLVFEAAARHLSFTRAAAELNVTQTAVSHQIRRLEEQLGLRLFVRRNRALELTPEAREYLPFVRTAFDELRAATERMLHTKARRRPDRQHARFDRREMAGAPAGRVSGSPSGHRSAYRDRHRLVDFRREEVDVAIRYGRGHWPGVRADWLMAEEIFPVCAPAFIEGTETARAARRPRQPHLVACRSGAG